MYVLGLTGSITMGKSWGVQCFRHLNIPVHDSDACVHALLGPGGAAVQDILDVFPGVENDIGGINRSKLSDSVFAHEAELALLEHILHPRVHAAQHQFLAKHARLQTKVVVLDIPLLFETRAQSRVDGILVMSAPVDLQYCRALARPHMTLDKLHAIMARQMPDALKCFGADFVVQTGLSRGKSLRKIKDILGQLKTKQGKVWQPNWSKGKY
ncbi:MAG: dephospho-CoA kinase [Magnetovibrio sp.]|nr:dephospho-CoA kinase [Magnetovibrio sp.]